ncbi:MAG: hypothetical protein RL122_384 [Pseudomonadota bacterium]
MLHQPPNLPRSHCFLLMLGYFCLVPHTQAAPSEFAPEISEGRPILCATLLPQRFYTWTPPQYGQLVRFGATTLCYLSQEGTPETLAFVETDNQHLITDVGTITLTSQPQSY